MANKSYVYRVFWALKEEGNRVAEDYQEVRATTVQRAISKAIKELNYDHTKDRYLEPNEEDFLKASDLLIITVENLGFKTGE